VFLCIVIAGILVGAQTYPGLDNVEAINILDNIILVVFSTEVICKIMSEGMQPLEYFIGTEWHWNCFDFFVVLLCMPFLPFKNGQVAFLRLIRLMRLAKVFRKVPQLRMIMSGLVGGLKSIVYIVVLLLLVFYLYAIAGIFFFRTNDPWHFNSIAYSLTTLFGIATLSNWSDIFYINYFGCAYYPADFYVLSPEEVMSTSPGAPRLCHSNPQPWLSLFYFVSFIFISSFSMLSLFVGAITVSMSESMQTMKIEKEKQRKLVKIRKAEEAIKRVKDRKERRSWALVEMAFNYGKVEVVSEDISQNSYLVQRYQRLARYCEKITTSSLFQNLVTLIIVVAGIQVGLATDQQLVRQLGIGLPIMDITIRVIFTAECALKLIAEELTPWKYFNNNWNVFDFIVVLGSYISGGGSIIVMLRLLRLLRVLKLMRMLPQLQVIVSALMSGFSSIAFISIILVLFFYFFGIIAMILFGANDPWHFGTLHMTMITLFQCATLDNWTDILYINLYGCDIIGYDDQMELCEHPHANFLVTSIFFIIFILLGALVLLTLFIGVVATSMEEAADEQKQTESVDGRVAEIAKDYKLSSGAILLYREVFDALDMNGGGMIDQNEMKLGMKAAGRMDITDKQFGKLWKQVDKDGSGGIDFAEFLAFMMSLRETGVGSGEGGGDGLSSPIPGMVIGDDPLTGEDRVEHNTHLVTAQLYNCAAAIGPLDASLKLDEMIKRTNTGRPSSAPRVYNRAYSLEKEKDASVAAPKMKKPTVAAGRVLSQRALGLFSGTPKIHPTLSAEETPSTKSTERALGHGEGREEEKSLEASAFSGLGVGQPQIRPTFSSPQLQLPLQQPAVDSPQSSPTVANANAFLQPIRTLPPSPTPPSLAAHGGPHTHKKGQTGGNSGSGDKAASPHPTPLRLSYCSPDDRDEEVHSQSYDGDLLPYTPVTSSAAGAVAAELGTHSSISSKAHSSHRKLKKKVISKLVFV
jgi:voltage-gated sodium channel